MASYFDIWMWARHFHIGVVSSLLNPSVNVANRIERATVRYGRSGNISVGGKNFGRGGGEVPGFILHSIVVLKFYNVCLVR